MVPADEERNKKLFPAQRPNQKGSIGILQQVALISTDDDPAGKCPLFVEMFCSYCDWHTLGVGSLLDQVVLEVEESFGVK